MQFHEIIFVFYWQKISDEWIFFRIVTVNGKILFIMASRLKFLRSQQKFLHCTLPHPFFIYWSEGHPATVYGFRSRAFLGRLLSNEGTPPFNEIKNVNEFTYYVWHINLLFSNKTSLSFTIKEIRSKLKPKLTPY